MAKEMMKMRLVRAITLCDIVIEDLNMADLDITIHKALTELHGLIIKKHDELTFLPPDENVLPPPW